MKDKELNLIIYLDDDGNTAKSYSENIEIKNGFVTFSTDDNTITIPSSRLLKIKKRIEKVGND